MPRINDTFRIRFEPDRQPRRSRYRHGSYARQYFDNIVEGMRVGEYVTACGGQEHRNRCIQYLWQYARDHYVTVVPRWSYSAPAAPVAEPAPRSTNHVYSRGSEAARSFEFFNSRRSLSANFEELRGRTERLRAETAQQTPVETIPTFPPGVTTFGIEIECIMPYDMSSSAELARILTLNGVPTYIESRHSNSNHWKIVGDGSLHDRSFGIEIVSPVLYNQEGFDTIRKVCNVLEANEVNVNKRCGFHVHVGARGMHTNFFKNLLEMYTKHERIIDSFMPISRRRNNAQYAQSMVGTQLASLFTPFAGRYYKLNLAAFFKNNRQTVEFRQHSGTTNAEKAIHWVEFCIAMVKAANVDVVSFNESDCAALMTNLNVSDMCRAHFMKRVNDTESVAA